MKKFFNYDGWLITLLTKMGELILVTIAFFICCLPIITITSSATSFYYTTIKSIRRGRGNPWKEFWESMKRTLKRGIQITLLLFLWYGSLGLGVMYFTNIKSVYMVLFLFSVAITLYIFPVLSRFELGVGAIIKLALVMSIRFYAQTILLIVSGAVCVWLCIFKLPMAMVLVLPGVWCYFSTFLVEKALLFYMPAPREDEDSWYYEKSSWSWKRGKNETS